MKRDTSVGNGFEAAADREAKQQREQEDRERDQAGRIAALRQRQREALLRQREQLSRRIAAQAKASTQRGKRKAPLAAAAGDAPPAVASTLRGAAAVFSPVSKRRRRGGEDVDAAATAGGAEGQVPWEAGASARGSPRTAAEGEEGGETGREQGEDTDDGAGEASTMRMLDRCVQWVVNHGAAMEETLRRNNKGNPHFRCAALPGR